MMPLEDTLVGLAVALGIGLLIGTERERNKGQGANRAIAGVRTFALTSLAGAIALSIGEVALGILGIIVGLLVVVGYQRTRSHDPGITTEIAQLTTFLLGAWAMRQPGLAAGVAVIVAIVLASRTRLHTFIHRVLTDVEVHDGLLLAAAALVIMPLLPDKAVDPWDLINVRRLWVLVVLLMAINALGYVALRSLGTRLGLPIAGLVSGFVSSTATIGAMGARAKLHPTLRQGAVAGAALSSVATVLQLAIVIGLTNLPALRMLLWPLVAAGLTAVAYGALFTLRSVRAPQNSESALGRPFDPRTALLFMAVLGCALIGSTLLTRWFGTSGLLLASGFAGFADAHAAAISAVSVAGGGDTVHLAAMGVLVGVTSNTVSKCVAAFTLGDRPFALQILPGLLLLPAVAWAVFAIQHLGNL
ncbi:MAG: DUF4010 domain-containing protein [Steroidobacteraceae bacterium]